MNILLPKFSQQTHVRKQTDRQSGTKTNSNYFTYNNTDRNSDEEK